VYLMKMMSGLFHVYLMKMMSGLFLQVVIVILNVLQYVSKVD